MENTLLIIKPDAVQRRLAGEILSRIERKGLVIKGLKMVRLSEDLVREHYSAHKGKPFYEPLVKFMTSAPVIVAVVSGERAVSVLRSMLGATACAESAPGTIRGDMGLSNRFNLVHASDSIEAAECEISLFFRSEELVDWSPDDYRWVMDLSTGEPV